MAASTVDAANIPLIDISSASSETAKQLLDAASTCGFVFVNNNEAGIPPADIHDMFELIPSTAGGPSWFAAHHDPSSGPSGSVLRLLYYPSVANHSPDALDIRAGAHSDYGSITLLFQLPGQPGLQILTGEGWRGVPADPAGVCAASGSRDGSSNGVEAGDGEGEEDAGGRALPILVNIGDLLSYWTHGLLRSTVHRVVFPTPPTPPTTSLPPHSASPLESQSADRYSIAYFCHPLDDARLVPVPSPLVAQLARAHGERGQSGPPDGVKTAREHLNERLAATYGAVGKGEERGEAVRGRRDGFE
ncbi:hypothetical protein LTR60_001242 [Cryomyces antarcticus]|nr:hypothetical protein LTR60_001242 [Cryomyces antarcticus]